MSHALLVGMKIASTTLGVCLTVSSSMILDVCTLDHSDLPCLGIYAIEMHTYVCLDTRGAERHPKVRQTETWVVCSERSPTGTWKQSWKPEVSMSYENWVTGSRVGRWRPWASVAEDVGRRKVLDNARVGVWAQLLFLCRPWMVHGARYVSWAPAVRGRKGEEEGESES